MFQGLSEQFACETQASWTRAIFVIYAHRKQVESHFLFLSIVAGKTSEQSFGDDLNRYTLKDVFRMSAMLRVTRELINIWKGRFTHLCQDGACFSHQVMIIL